jgi:DNA-binding MarR family transcriptional regulator
MAYPSSKRGACRSFLNYFEVSVRFCCLDNSCLNDYYLGMSAAVPKKITKRKFDSREQEAYLSLWRTYDRLRSFEDAVFAEWELTAQQYNLLRLLSSAAPDPVPTLTLAAKLISKAPDITRMLDRLEERSWIVRTRSLSDRRAVLVSITESGLKLLDALAEGIANLHELQLGHLSATQLKSLCDLLRKARHPHEPTDSPWK